MRIKIKDSDNPLSKKEERTANLAFKKMDAEDREYYLRRQVVYWDTDAEKIVR